MFRACLEKLSYRLVTASLVTLAVFQTAKAQEIGMARLPPGPHYVGEPLQIQIVARGFNDGEAPTCRYTGSPSPQLEVRGPQVSQSSRSFSTIRNGRFVTNSSRNYGFNFLFTPAKAGDFEIGPFVVEHNGQQHQIQAIRVQFEQLANDPEMQLEITLGLERIYVGQRVPVTIRWSMTPDSNEALQYAYENLEIRSPLFDQFSFEDKRQNEGANLTLMSSDGGIRVSAQQTQRRINGRTMIELTAERTMIADSIGEFIEIPVTCRTKKASGFRRSFFSTEAVGVRPAIATGKPMTFSVLPLPSEGRPESFAGAVGTGFSIDVSANRSVVRVGDPISLGISISGDGNLEKLSLPSLSADGGMQNADFQLPDEATAGSFNGTNKQFKVGVRVKSENVNQVPALAFSWFDPAQEKYLTTRSKPIALQVMPAQLVTANDVVSVARSEPDGETDFVHEKANSESALSSKEFSIPSGANLAIETDIRKLMASGGGWMGSGVVQFGTYCFGLVAVLAAVMIRRRSEVDPQIAAEKNEATYLRQQLMQAKSLEPKAGFEQVASVLRKVARKMPAGERNELNDLIQRCEDAIYAPTAGSSTAAGDLIESALEMLERVRVRA